MDKLNGEIIADAPLPDPNSQSYYGGQIKSWYIPSDTRALIKNAGHQFYSIGNRKDLYNMFDMGRGDQEYTGDIDRGWHASVYKISTVLTRAIGYANIFYVTGGNKFAWTDDLIK